jgi:hypothetical protein
MRLLRSARHHASDLCPGLLGQFLSGNTLRLNFSTRRCMGASLEMPTKYILPFALADLRRDEPAQEEEPRAA